MEYNRLSGILLHPTCFEGTNGIGTIGKKAYEFVDWLKKANQSLWQILPLGPTGYGDSPYASFSTFAGNPLLIDLDLLLEKKWATQDLCKKEDYIKDTGPVDFGSVVWWKLPVLDRIAKWFLENCAEEDRVLYESFKNDNSSWLDSYANFMSIKSFYDKKAQEEKLFGIETVWFNYWPKELSKCDPLAVSKWNSEHTLEIEIIKVIQFFFFYQWSSLKKYASDNGVSIIGDIPIFVAADSCDVWANQELFQLDENSIPKNVAGVPPDYFCATGQLWGNPLYDWNQMKKTNYFWWINRIKHVLTLVDYIRIDHFRGFEAYWSVPFGEETAINGQWIQGPAHELFNAINQNLGKLPLIAEDLGVITEGVKALRDDFNFPGMKVLQFAFDTNEAKQNGMINSFLPHMYNQNCVCYTGTHDNDTMQGWLEKISDEQLQLVASYAYGKTISVEDSIDLRKSKQLCQKLITLAISSTANFVVIPVQDLFAIDNEGRINEPSTVGKNWKWRFNSTLLTDEKALELKSICDLYARNIGNKNEKD